MATNKKKVAKRKEGVHIQRSADGKQFFVDEVASNGNILQHSENVNRKQSAFKNIIAMGKLLAAVMAGEEYVFDEKGDKWIYNRTGKNKGKFTNTSVMLRKTLGPPLRAFAKDIEKQVGKPIKKLDPLLRPKKYLAEKKAAKKK